jgi:hypothetical protein
MLSIVIGVVGFLLDGLWAYIPTVGIIISLGLFGGNSWIVKEEAGRKQ